MGVKDAVMSSSQTLRAGPRREKSEANDIMRYKWKSGLAGLCTSKTVFDLKQAAGLTLCLPVGGEEAAQNPQQRSSRTKKTLTKRMNIRIAENNYWSEALTWSIKYNTAFNNSIWSKNDTQPVGFSTKVSSCLMAWSESSRSSCPLTELYLRLCPKQYSTTRTDKIIVCSEEKQLLA